MERMNIWRIIISAGTTFIIIGAGAMGVAIVASDGKPLSKTAITAALLTGVVAGAKEVRSMMALPPLTNGSSESLNRLLTVEPPKAGTDKGQNETEKHE